MKAAGDAGTHATDAVARENTTIAGSATARIPHRSARRPTTGVAIPVIQSPTTIAEETKPRLQPNCRVIDGNSVPNVNCITGPFPTSKPSTEANTIHQRLLNSRPMRQLSSLRIGPGLPALQAEQSLRIAEADVHALLIVKRNVFGKARSFAGGLKRVIHGKHHAAGTQRADRAQQGFGQNIPDVVTNMCSRIYSEGRFFNFSP